MNLRLTDSPKSSANTTHETNHCASSRPLRSARFLPNTASVADGPRPTGWLHCPRLACHLTSTKSKSFNTRVEIVAMQMAAHTNCRRELRSIAVLSVCLQTKPCLFGTVCGLHGDVEHWWYSSKFLLSRSPLAEKQRFGGTHCFHLRPRV